MPYPKTIIHILSGLDGRITGPFMGHPSIQSAGQTYGKLRRAYNADAWLFGTVTTKEFLNFKTPALTKGSVPSCPGDFVADHTETLYYVSVDTAGEIGWESGTFHKSGRPDAHVIEVLIESTDPAYRAYLEEHGVSYILAGKTQLDCHLACEKLSQLFGIQTLLICGGGTINWTFLQQGVVDELSLLLAPAADGSTGNVTVFEQSPLSSGSPVAFKLKSADTLEDDIVYLIYTPQNRK